ncbi:APC family permease [Vagococcus teuberi]|nr:APC family permease [Vagococcus teuberi]
MDEKKQYGLWTAIAMIIGICVGSGIFFKVGNILAFTGGNIFLGVLVFIIGALCIIFGSLSLTNLAERTTKNGGMVAYFEEFFSEPVASAFGWYQTFLYFPTICVVVSWAAGTYTTLLLNLPQTLPYQMGIGFCYMVFFYLLNIVSSQFAGWFQIISTITKLIPLIGIGLIAIFWTKDVPTVPTTATLIEPTDVGLGWLAALAPMAFSYDGWPIALSISHEVKGGSHTMKKALCFGPVIVLVVYLSYFLGLTHILGPEYILSMGEGAVMEIGEMLFGHIGQKVILLFILVALFGVINGVTLGHIRMPYALATKNMLPNSQKIINDYHHKKFVSTSAIIALLTGCGWFIIHYITQAFQLMGLGDIGEIAIVFGYMWYMALYFKVIQLYLDKDIQETFTGLISPILAIVGGLIILFGGFYENPIFEFVSFGICFLFCLMGYITFKKNRQNLLNK